MCLGPRWWIIFPHRLHCTPFCSLGSPCGLWTATACNFLSLLFAAAVWEVPQGARGGGGWGTCSGLSWPHRPAGSPSSCSLPPSSLPLPAREPEHSGSNGVSSTCPSVNTPPLLLVPGHFTRLRPLSLSSGHTSVHRPFLKLYSGKFFEGICILLGPQYNASFEENTQRERIK